MMIFGIIFMEIVEQLKQHLKDFRQQSSNGGSTVKPATVYEIERAESLLRFSLPEIVRHLYIEISNGGFGPGKGLLDIVSAANEYVSFRNEREHSQPEWPLQLIPVCDWGCNIYSCLDCSSSNVPVVRVDYNLDVPWMKQTYIIGPNFQFFDPYSNEAVVAWIEAMTLEKWFSDWLSGVDLFRQAYPPRKPKII